MKTGKAIKLTLFLASIGSALYHAPQIIEMTEQVKAMSGGLSGEGGNAFDMLAKLQGSGQLGGGVPVEPDEPELQIFSPDMDALSEAQRAELLAAAQRMRPRIQRDPNGNPTANTPESGGATGASGDPNRISIGGIDPSILKQLENLGGAEEVLKQLGGSPK